MTFVAGRPRKRTRLVPGLAGALLASFFGACSSETGRSFSSQEANGSAMKIGFESYADIKNHHQTLQSVDDLLQRFPSAYWDTSSLVYHSFSQQSGSIQEPRILLWKFRNKPDGARYVEMILAVTGSTDEKKGGNVAEIIAPDVENGAYRFARLQFPQASCGTMATPSASPPASLRWDENPTACVSCHQGSPAWNAYPYWPGFIGSSSYVSEMGSGVLFVDTGHSLPSWETRVFPWDRWRASAAGSFPSRYAYALRANTFLAQSKSRGDFVKAYELANETVTNVLYATHYQILARQLFRELGPDKLKALDFLLRNASSREKPPFSQDVQQAFDTLGQAVGNGFPVFFEEEWAKGQTTHASASILPMYQQTLAPANRTVSQRNEISPPFSQGSMATYATFSALLRALNLEDKVVAPMEYRISPEGNQRTIRKIHEMIVADDLDTYGLLTALSQVLKETLPPPLITTTALE